MTPWVIRLLTANVVVYFLTASIPGVAEMLAFIPAVVHLRPWTPITYMFVHAGFTHLLFNMIGLFFFGPRLETRLGDKGFLLLYFLSGLGGALFFVLFDRGTAVVGASGAVYGIVFAFAYFWPRENIYIWGVLPIQARWLAVMVVALSLYSGISGAQSGVAHFAHLGGIAIAYGYLRGRQWRRDRKRKKSMKEFLEASQAGPRLEKKKEKDRAVERWKAIQVDSLHELNRSEVRALLEKVDSRGAQSLSDDERAFLNRMANMSP